MAWTEEQRRNAAVIYQVGLELGASLRDIQIAIMAGIVESGLRNLNYGDRDSIGMFQQRDAWGSRSARLDPYQSSRMFFLGGAAGQRGLLDFGNRGEMGMGEAAQAVQVSAFPDRYAQHTSEAANLLKMVGDTDILAAGGGLGAGPVPSSSSTSSVAPLDMSSLTGTPTLEDVVGPSTTEVDGVGAITADESGIGALEFGEGVGEGPSPLDAVSFGQRFQAGSGSQLPGLMDDLKMPSLEDLGVPTPKQASPFTTDSFDGNLEGWREQAVAGLRKMLGTPYVWGGTSYNGVDCSGLIYLIYRKLGIEVPRISADQARFGKRIGFGDLKPGDFVAIDNSSRNNGADHIGIFVGNGQVIHAPRPGSSVEITGLGSFSGGWGVRVGK